MKRSKIIFSVVLILTFVSLSFAQAFPFGPARNDLSLIGGGINNAIVNADVNNDGKQDLIVGNCVTRKICVYLGNGDGTFGSSTNYTVTNSGSGGGVIVPADFNGDSKVDLAVSKNTGFVVFINNGDGTFALAVSYGSGSTSAIVPMQVNPQSNSFIDLAVLHNSAITIWDGNGNGTFTNLIDVPTNIEPVALAEGNFDGDAFGTSDLAALDGSGLIAVLINDFGDGIDWVETDYGAGTGDSYAAITAADYDGDSKPDIAIGGFDLNSVMVLGVFINHGDGTFNSEVNYSNIGIPTQASALVSADINNDGNQDILAVGFSSNAVELFNGVGDGTFNAPQRYFVNVNPRKLAVADFNSDGFKDVITSNGTSKSLSVLLNSGEGTLREQLLVYNTGTNPEAVGSADFNSDGKLDIVTANTGSDDISVFFGNGDGTLTASSSYGLSCFGFGGCFSLDQIAVADLNSDSNPDIAVANGDDSTLVVFLNNGDSTFASEVAYPAGNCISSVGAADLNGDGFADLAGYDPCLANVYVLINNSDGTFATAIPYPISLQGSGVNNILPVDVNNDGQIDIAIADASVLAILINNGDGTFGIDAEYSGGAGDNGITSGDFNGDGHVDIAIASLNDSKVYIFMNNNDGTFAAGVSYSASILSYSIVAGDFNQDGKIDLATGALGDGAAILLGIGDGTFGVATKYGTAGDSGFITAADLNRDGKSDLITTNYGTSTITILYDLAPPSITSTSPSTATDTNPIDIHGIGFAPNSLFTYGGSSHTYTFISNTVLRFTPTLQEVTGDSTTLQVSNPIPSSDNVTSNLFVFDLNLHSSSAGHAQTSATPTPLSSQISEGNLGGQATPAQYGLTEGDLISTSGLSAEEAGSPDIYIVNEYGYKRLFINPIIFNFYGHLSWSKVKMVTPLTRDAFLTSNYFRNCENNDQKVYALEVTTEDTGIFHHINMSADAVISQDPNFFKKVFCINTREYNWYPKSPTDYTTL